MSEDRRAGEVALSTAREAGGWFRMEEFASVGGSGKDVRGQDVCSGEHDRFKV